MRRIGTLFMGCLLAGTSFAFATPSAQAAPVQEGKEWRELYQTTGLSWAAIATVCPTDGATACNGSVGGYDLTGWTWATAPQVLALMDDYSPGLAALEPPQVSGIAGFFAGGAFLGAMRWTGYMSLTYSYSEWAYGWTASTDASGLPIGGGASYSHQGTGTTANGSLGVGAAPDRADSYTGAFLWRTAGLDYTPPTVTPTVTGTLGGGGWYRSNVNVSWTVTDPESTIVSTSGCATSVLVTDTAGNGYTCTATSAGVGGPTTASVTVKRDTTPPVLACVGAAPVFSLGESATMSASVSDTMSGPSNSTTTQSVNTATAGSKTAVFVSYDVAGNVGQRSCPYSVAVPKCMGKTPTIIGSIGNDTINGTAGADVILALGGNDLIYGAGGNDTICAGDGWDTVYGDAGIDKVDGGLGNDDLNGGAAADDLNGGADLDSIRGDAGADRCTSGELRMSSCATLY
jgi:RTX calcium-binding nonapeptide repeat (4 copies)